MLKIDLHIHTQKCKSGDGTKRNITPENFIKKMYDNDVCICAITNHNKFDLEEFKKIKSLDDELTIFPGIELDVVNDKYQSHIVLVCDPEKSEKFHTIFDNDPTRNYDEFTLSSSELISKIKEFKTDEIIIIPHFLDKDKRRSINSEFKHLLEQELIDYVMILEPGKLATMGIINAHNELAIIGSDVKDWSSYSSYNLPEIKFKIESFKKFIELAKDGTLLIKSLLNETQSEDIEFDGGKIPIYNDINIIFGEKGSGKTILLENEIFSHYEKTGKRIIFHKGSEYREKYKQILNEKIEKMMIDVDIQGEIAVLFNKIVNYKEPTIKNFVKIYLECKQKESNNKNRNLLKKTSAHYTNSKNEFSEIQRKLEKKLNKINKVCELNEQEDRNITDKSQLSHELKKLRQYIIEKSKTEFQDSFTDLKIYNFLDTIKNSADKKTGTKSKPNDIGFAALVKNRLDRYKWNIEINQLLNEIQQEETYKLGELPIKGEVYLTTKVIVLSEEKYIDSPFDKGNIVVNRKIMGKIRNFNIAKFSNKINNYFTKTEKMSGDLFVDQVIRKYPESSKDYPETKSFPGMFLRKKGVDTPYNPSEGEKSILSIVAILESQEYDCYLFDEMERGLGNKYIADYIIPRLKQLRDNGKTLIISTHNANIAISTLPSQSIYCRYPHSSGYYMIGNMYSNQLINFKNPHEIVQWEPLAIEHLEGNETMFVRRKNIWNQ
ncbi:hypothetical protein [Enterococcus thailandicus]|uniref:Histidinol-phosphatase n=1 Tax=Enterococcus thailandicus TaxID=417368 RepID=A0A179ES06_ENTTH|nr:hypothetical protein [Enterococcus thailandicus]OAQ55650.1 hypothetical protein A6E74_06195 [Enterococcus thailandicus]